MPIFRSKDKIPEPSREELKRLEKQGKYYATAREIQEEAAKNRRRNEAEAKEKSREALSEQFQRIKHGQGRKYIKELEEMRKNAPF